MNLLFQTGNIEKFPLCVKEKVTITYVVTGRVAVLGFFRKIGWRKIGPSEDGNYRKSTSFGPNLSGP